MLSTYLVLSSLMFSGSILGILLNSNNLILVLMYIELMLLAVNNNFIVFSRLWNDINGQIFVLFIFIVAILEMAIALAIILKFFCHKKNNLRSNSLESSS